MIIGSSWEVCTVSEVCKARIRLRNVASSPLVSLLYLKASPREIFEETIRKDGIKQRNRPLGIMLRTPLYIDFRSAVVRPEIGNPIHRCLSFPLNAILPIPTVELDCWIPPCAMYSSPVAANGSILQSAMFVYRDLDHYSIIQCGLYSSPFPLVRCVRCGARLGAPRHTPCREVLDDHGC